MPTLVQQNYSRLVIDCNRPPGAETSIPEISELTPVPGNAGLSEERESRARARDFPALSRTHRNRARPPAAEPAVPTALIAMHSFTPVFKGVARPWHAGVLYNRDPRFAHLLMALLKREAGSRRRRQRALHRHRRVGLHHSGPRRAPRLASRGDRDPPGSDQRDGRRSAPGPSAWRACCRWPIGTCENAGAAIWNRTSRSMGKAPRNLHTLYRIAGEMAPDDGIARQLVGVMIHGAALDAAHVHIELGDLLHDAG